MRPEDSRQDWKNQEERGQGKLEDRKSEKGEVLRPTSGDKTGESREERSGETGGQEINGNRGLATRGGETRLEGF